MGKGRAVALLLGSLVLLGATASGAGAATPSGPRVLSLTLNGVVDPFMASYVQRGVATAEADGDTAILLTIDTPGGLDSSMREIVKAILGSQVPVVCYTAPSGARAASAGTFIMLSCPVNGMAPGTNIGAAHPVGVSGAIENEKVTNDAAAFIRSLATRWQRNAQWADDAVRNAISVSSEEALRIHVVDLIEPTPAALLAAVGPCRNGAAPPTTGLLADQGALPGLTCARPTIVPFGMSLSERLFHAFADPSVAFLLLNIGFLALIAWIFHPGFHASLAVGIISMVLALAILETLPVRLTGVLLLLVAMVLFVLDVKATAHGVLTTAGAAVMVVGGLLLFNPSVPSAHVPLPLILGVAISAALFAFFVLRGLLDSRRHPVQTGTEVLERSTGVALTALEPQGMVRARGESWSAESIGDPIPSGSEVRIVRVKGVKLYVERAEDRAGSPDAGSMPHMTPAGGSRGSKEGEAR
jgi:membrane-bound serine protease (ClpP class)